MRPVRYATVPISSLRRSSIVAGSFGSWTEEVAGEHISSAAHSIAVISGRVGTHTCAISGPKGSVRHKPGAHSMGCPTALRHFVPCVDGSELARTFFTLQHWSVRPCVRPLGAVHMTACHNALRGSATGGKDASPRCNTAVGGSGGTYKHGRYWPVS